MIQLEIKDDSAVVFIEHASERLKAGGSENALRASRETLQRREEWPSAKGT